MLCQSRPVQLLLFSFVTLGGRSLRGDHYIAPLPFEIEGRRAMHNSISWGSRFDLLYY
jgi:hypothetical protein